jgi:hypothetical protein
MRPSRCFNCLVVLLEACPRIAIRKDKRYKAQSDQSDNNKEGAPFHVAKVCKKPRLLGGVGLGLG